MVDALFRQSCVDRPEWCSRNSSKRAASCQVIFGARNQLAWKRKIVFDLIVCLSARPCVRLQIYPRGLEAQDNGSLFPMATRPLRLLVAFRLPGGAMTKHGS